MARPRSGNHAPPGRRPHPRPTLRLERRLLGSGARRLGGMDEVGRGSPAGPVFVGIVALDASVGPSPAGVRDSKLLTPAAREALVPRIEEWAVAAAVGSAGATEIDELGMTASLRLAGNRALARLPEPLDLVVLDGGHDWLSGDDGPGGRDRPPDVVTRVRGDLTCTSVAAASILAKVARDAVMVGLAEQFPGYGWEANKGYGTAAHLEAIRRLGTTPQHRRSWRLPDPA